MAQDHSLRASAAVVVAYAYPFAQVVYLGWVPGEPAWPAGGIVLVTLGAVLSLTSLLSLGRWFGVHPGWKKDLFAIWCAHRPAYAATVIGAALDLARKIEKAMTLKGLRLILALAPCPTGWGYEPGIPWKWGGWP